MHSFQFSDMHSFHGFATFEIAKKTASDKRKCNQASFCICRIWTFIWLSVLWRKTMSKKIPSNLTESVAYKNRWSKLFRHLVSAIHINIVTVENVNNVRYTPKKINRQDEQQKSALNSHSDDKLWKFPKIYSRFRWTGLLLLLKFFLLPVDFCVSSIKSVERTFEYNAAGFPIEIHYNLMRGRKWKEN